MYNIFYFTFYEFGQMTFIFFLLFTSKNKNVLPPADLITWKTYNQEKQNMDLIRS